MAPLIYAPVAMSTNSICRVCLLMRFQALWTRLLLWILAFLETWILKFLPTEPSEGSPNLLLLGREPSRREGFWGSPGMVSFNLNLPQLRIAQAEILNSDYLDLIARGKIHHDSSNNPDIDICLFNPLGHLLWLLSWIALLLFSANNWHSQASIQVSGKTSGSPGTIWIFGIRLEF